MINKTMYDYYIYLQRSENVFDSIINIAIFKHFFSSNKNHAFGLFLVN